MTNIKTYAVGVLAAVGIAGAALAGAGTAVAAPDHHAYPKSHVPHVSGQAAPNKGPSAERNRAALRKPASATQPSGALHKERSATPAKAALRHKGN